MSAERPRHRRLKLATLMGLVAFIAVGLAIYRARIAPWLVLKKIHPAHASVRDLITARPSQLSCTGCHEPTVARGMLALSSFERRCTLDGGMNVNGTPKDCRSCHAP